jgi:hypothetical protein
MVLTWYVRTEDGWTCPRTRSQAVPTPLMYASPRGTLVIIGLKAWQALCMKWVMRCTNRYVHATTVRVTVFDDSYHVSVERDVEISTTQIMDCCGVVLYYLVTHTITSLNILSIYWLLSTRNNTVKHFIYRVEILSTTTCRCPSPFPWGSMRASRYYGNVWSSRWLLTVLTLFILLIMYCCLQRLICVRIRVYYVTFGLISTLS